MSKQSLCAEFDLPSNEAKEIKHKAIVKLDLTDADYLVEQIEDLKKRFGEISLKVSLDC